MKHSNKITPFPYNPAGWTITINGEKPFGFYDTKICIGRDKAEFCLQFSSPWVKQLIDEIHTNPNKELHFHVSYLWAEGQESEVYADFKCSFDGLEYHMEAGREVPDVNFWINLPR